MECEAFSTAMSGSAVSRWSVKQLWACLVRWYFENITRSLQRPYSKQLICRSNGKVKWSRYRLGVAQRVGRGMALLFHDRGTRREWVVSSTPRPHFTPKKDSVPILQEAGCAPGPAWMGEKICRSTYDILYKGINVCGLSRPCCCLFLHLFLRRSQFITLTALYQTQTAEFACRSFSLSAVCVPQ